MEQMKCADVHFNVWQLKKAIAKWKGVFDNAEESVIKCDGLNIRMQMH